MFKIRKTVRPEILGIIVSAAVLTISAATTSAAQGGAVSGACGLITQQEAATALGAPVPAGAEKSLDFPVEGVLVKAQACMFGSVVVVARYELGSGAQTLFGKYRQSFSSQPGSSDYQTVNGIGEEAFTAKGQLHIRKGQLGLLLGITMGDRQNDRIAAKTLAAEKELAALALGRL